jgi:hypothetical protein
VILKAPFQLLPDFLNRFGYRDGRRFVALFWEPCGDEACYDDGISSACGMSDNWLYLDFIHQPDVNRWLDENAFRLGNSDEEARHWMVVDAVMNEVYAATRAEACRMVRTQHVPADPTETIRRQRLVELNAEAATREALEARYGKVWTTDELAVDFEVVGFMAPLVVVRRKADGVKGSLEFQHQPRLYFNFQPHQGS